MPGLGLYAERRVQQAHATIEIARAAERALLAAALHHDKAAAERAQ